MDVSPSRHAERYVEFSRLELLTSGPGPHRKVAERLARESPDPAWAIGLYGMAYTTAGMEVLLRYFPDRGVFIGPDEVSVVAPLVPHRDERVVNGWGPKRLYEMLKRYQGWLLTGGLEQAQQADSFDEAFKLVGGQLQHFGRFFGIKLYEALERTVGLPHFDDIRPHNGHWARKSLQLVWPHHDPYDNSKRGRDEAHGLANTLRFLAEDNGVHLEWFEVESMLCNYRQGCNGKKYPGGDVDGDLGFINQGRAKNPDLEFRSLQHREQVVPGWARGEVQGWTGIRSLLYPVMRDHDYLWSDSHYDWQESIQDLSTPFHWIDAERPR